MLTSNHHWDGPVYTGINLIVLVETSAYRRFSAHGEKFICGVFHKTDVLRYCIIFTDF